jgi:hypothetical protein
MAYVEDIAASAAASWADSFSSPTQITFGAKTINFGGSQSVSADTRLSQETETSAASDAVASTAKAGDGGLAESSAAMTKMPAAAGLPAAAVYAGIALAALAAGLGLFALLKKNRK